MIRIPLLVLLLGACAVAGCSAFQPVSRDANYTRVCRPGSSLKYSVDPTRPWPYARVVAAASGTCKS